MPHCTKCGAMVGEGVAFCPNCGAPQAAATSGGVMASPAGSGTSGMSENVAGLLCYSLGWVTGLIFFLIDKRPFVRFHAAQSMVVFGGLQIIQIVLGRIFFASMYSGGVMNVSMGSGLLSLLGLLAFVLWILLMIKAYQHERF